MASAPVELKRPRGRPSTYSEEMAERICHAIATTADSLATICEAEGFPHWQTVYAWREREPLFAEAYTRARNARLEMMAEELLPLAESTIGKNSNEIQSAKLRVDTRKWLLSKLVPATYGDRIDVTSKGEKLEAPSHTIDARIQSIVLTAQRRQASVDSEELDERARGLLE